MNEKLAEYLSQGHELPTIPEIASRAMALLDDPDASLDQLREVIQRDPAVVSRILRVANSAMYSFSRQIETLGQALPLLGMREVRNLVLTISLRGIFRDYGALEKLLFEHASMAGPAAARLARELDLRVTPDEVFVAGLLHDLGKLSLANTHRAQCEDILARLDREPVSSAEAERAVFGFDHAELGANLALNWQLSARLEAVIRHHHSPEAWPGLQPEVRELTQLVSLTTAILTKLGIGRRSPAESIELSKLSAWTALGIDPAREHELLSVVQHEIEKAAALSE